jgi:hypothetical protein
VIGQTEALNMRLLGHSDLGGHGNGGEGIGVRVRQGRRYVYIAHETGPVNFSVVDATDPTSPRLVEQPTLAEAGLRSNSLSVVGDVMVVCYQEALHWKGSRPQRLGLEVFDLSRPDAPRSIGFWDASGPQSRGTHCVWFVDGRYAYLSTGTPDSQPAHPSDDQFPVILDLSDPARPREVGRWWLPGTQVGDGVEIVRHARFDMGFRSHNINVYPEQPDRAYVAYLDGGVVILDISDRSKPRMISRVDNSPPMPGFTHTVLPLISRGLLAVTDEAIRDACEDYPKLLWFMDASVEENPVFISTAPLPDQEDFCARGGRSGAHNLHENDPVELAWRSDEVIVGAFFNVGVRAYDIRNPFQPREIAHFVPSAPPGSPAGAIQMNDVFVDEQRLIYAIDRFTGGLYIIEPSF